MSDIIVDPDRAIVIITQLKKYLNGQRDIFPDCSRTEIDIALAMAIRDIEIQSKL